jgi:general L-amino acid transport system substrate-binding protein
VASFALQSYINGFKDVLSMKTIHAAVFLLVTALGASLFPFPATAGDTLTRIKSRGKLRCGVSDGILGLSLKEADGRWTGIDADFCRALAAAVLGDPAKVELVSLAASARFPSLKAAEIDVLVRNTTWTLEREATLEVMFAGVLYYDGQSFLVPAKDNINDLSQFNGSTICVVKGTTHEGNLADYFSERGWSYQPMIVETQAQAAEALFSDKCQAFTSERPQLTAMRLKAQAGPEAYAMLPEQISKEPMGPVVRRGDDEWFTIVRWVLFALIRAEEIGLTQSNIRSRLEAKTGPTVLHWLNLDGIISKALAIPPGWATRVVETVGNYGEMFERNLGSHSVLKLERGLNRLWTQGGLMCAPPFH